MSRINALYSIRFSFLRYCAQIWKLVAIYLRIPMHEHDTGCPPFFITCIDLYDCSCYFWYPQNSTAISQEFPSYYRCCLPTWNANLFVLVLDKKESIIHSCEDKNNLVFFEAGRKKSIPVILFQNFKIFTHKITYKKYSKKKNQNEYAYHLRY